jgi:molecular chaperone GrpE
MSKHGHGNNGGQKEEAKGNPGESQERSAEAKQEISEEEAQAVSSPGESSAPETADASTTTEPLTWEQKAAELEAKLAELNDQYLRKAADFENFRKRTVREKQELVDFANQNLLLDLLPVIDDFDRAIKSAETSKDFASFYEGITMIEKRLSAQLESKWGLKRFDSEGEPFDPNRHEALQMERAAGITEPVVKEDFVKGYTLKDRVIRFAKVKVLMPEEETAAGGKDTEASG